MASVAIACFAVAAAALAALVPAAADSGVPAPLRQMAEGIEAGDILCNTGRTLLVSPDGAPACVFAGSLEALVDRGWLAAPEEGDAGQGQSAIAPSVREQPLAWQERTASSSYPPNVHTTP